MNRRSFLRVLSLSPIMALPVSVASATDQNPLGKRISCINGDAGYREYCLAIGDGTKVQVFLDGVEQRAVTADEREGFVVRPVTTERGNLAHDGLGNILEETVYGDVKIVFTPRG